MYSNECVHVYTDNNSLILLNHADGIGIGSVGFEVLTKKDFSKLYHFGRMLSMVASKCEGRMISEIQIIGCDVSEKLAQSISNICDINVRTLPNLHKLYPKNQFGSGRSKLLVDPSLNYFSYGYVFDDKNNFEVQKIMNNKLVNTFDGEDIIVEKDWTKVELLLEYLNHPLNTHNFYEPISKNHNLIKENTIQL